MPDNILQILIEADATGLTTQLMRAQQTIVSFVDKMNEQEVDWTSILSKTISPAIITGIASMFADAIIQSVQFQESQQNLGAALGLTSDQLSNVGSSAQDIAESTGASVSSIQQAFQALLPVLGGSIPDATTAAQNAAELAQMGFGDLGSIVQNLTPILGEFNITSGEGTVQVLTDLMNAAQASGLSIPTLEEAFAQFADQAKNAGATASNLEDIFVNLGVAAGKLGSIQDATALLKTFFTAGTGQNLQLNVSLGTSPSQIQDFIQGGNISQGLDEISTKAKSLSQLVQTSLGITPQELASFTTYSQHYDDIAAQVKSIEANLEPIALAWQQSDNAVRELQKDWNLVQVSLTSGALATAVEDLAKWIGEMLDDLKPIAATELPVIESIFSTLVTDGEGLYGAIDGFVKALTGASIGDILKGMITDFNKIVQTIEVFVDGLTSGVQLAAEIGKVLLDVATFNWGSVSKDIQAIFTPTAAMQNTFNALGTLFSDQGIVPGTTAAGAAAAAAPLLAGSGLAAAPVLNTGTAALTAGSGQIGNLVQALVTALQGSGGSTPATFNNNYTINNPTGGNGITADQIFKTQYKQFQGM